ncbi:MAG: hypothetical protein WCP15_01695 [bacterium]
MEELNAKNADSLGLEKLKPDLRMQVELTLRFYGLKKEDVDKDTVNEYLMKWISHNDNQFSADFRRVLAENPDILPLYETDPETALNKMESLLYVEKVGI